MRRFKHITIIILDGLGCGAQEDYRRYHSKKYNTLLSIYKKNRQARGQFCLPILENLGLSKILFNKDPKGPFCAGTTRLKTAGNDTSSGIWELVGAPNNKRYKSDKKGFSAPELKRIETQTGISFLCNRYIAGNKALRLYYDVHLRTKKPILYFDDDGIVLVTAHEKIIPPDRLIKIGKLLSAAIRGRKLNINRVIVRSFSGRPPLLRRPIKWFNYFMTASPPIFDTLINLISRDKISMGATKHLHQLFHSPRNLTAIRGYCDNEKMLKTILLGKNEWKIKIACLQNFDSYGHSKKPLKSGEKLIELDNCLRVLLKKMRPDDLLIITADHGNDHNSILRGHTREKVPLLFYFQENRKKIWLGERQTLADIGQTICYNFSLPPLKHGSVINELFDS